MPRRPMAESLLIKTFVRNYPNSMGWNQLLETTGLSRRSLTSGLEKLINKGKVEHKFGEKYIFTEEAHHKYNVEWSFEETKKYLANFKPEDSKSLGSEEMPIIVDLFSRQKLTGLANYEISLINEVIRVIADYQKKIGDSDSTKKKILIARF